MAIPLNVLDKRAVQIGFIGLGLMGSRLARRLHSAGWNVQAWNRSPGPADSLRKKGAVIAPSLAELVNGSDVSYLPWLMMRQFTPYISARGASFLRQCQEPLFSK